MRLVFLPCTREIRVSSGVVYRPIRSWHSGTLAGEGITIENGDRSGCLEIINNREITSRPRTAIHRLYWHVDKPGATISAFLSYPNGMGIVNEYFWECLFDDVERFTGEGAEKAMESAIVKHFTMIRRRDIRTARKGTGEPFKGLRGARFSG